MSIGKPIVVLAMYASLAAAQTNPCNERLKPPGSDPQGYRLRGDRCEGVYVREVAGTTALSVASFTQAFDKVEPSAVPALSISWTSPGREPVRLSAVALRSRLYYRMDTIREAGVGSYRWPTDILRSLSIGGGELGVFGRTSVTVGNRVVDLYLPLSVSGGGPRSPSAGYRLVIWPGVDLSEAYLTLAAVDSTGRRTATVLNGQPLAYGYYPADRGVPVSIQKLKSPGMYVLDVGATLRSGGSTGLQVWFYHSGN